MDTSSKATFASFARATSNLLPLERRDKDRRGRARPGDRSTGLCEDFDVVHGREAMEEPGDARRRVVARWHRRRLSFRTHLFQTVRKMAATRHTDPLRRPRA